MTRLIAQTDLERYVVKNRGTCRTCKYPVFWASTSTGKRIPMDFPDTALGHHLNYRLVLGYGENGWDGTCEAWPTKSQATHSCHLDTCKGDPAANAAKAEKDWEAKMVAERGGWS